MIDKANPDSSGTDANYAAPPGPPPAYPQETTKALHSQPQLVLEHNASTFGNHEPLHSQPGLQPDGETAAQLGERYRSEMFARCAMGNHEREKKYGVCGIICAIVFFPIGLICLFSDVEERCARCGKRL